MSPKKITILGSTGSIGRSALDVIVAHPGRFEVIALTAGRNIGLLADQVIRVGERTFGRVTAGYQELQYAGVGGEFLHIFGDGRLAAGISADWNIKRKPDFTLGFRDYDTYTLQGNLYYTIPEMGLTTHIYGGRFLAGDKGAGVRVSREFKTGAIVSFWYSNTDTSDLSGFNSGYEDKGFALMLPARIFQQKDSPVRYTYAISPYTRDVGQLVHYWNTLADFVRGMNPSAIEENLEDLRE